MGASKSIPAISERFKGGLPRAVYANGVYVNPWEPFTTNKSLGELLKWFRERPKLYYPTEEEKHKYLPVDTPDPERLRKGVTGEEIQVTWMGHSSILVQMDGLSFLTDPVWSDYCAPMKLPGVPHRLVKVPCSLRELPKIDFVVISHSHYDHLDIQTVKAIGNEPVWYVPLGLKSWFGKAGITNCVEVDWWQEVSHKNDIKVVATPAQHWSSRTPWDRNTSLWCSWTILGSKSKFFYTGDTGYCSGFKHIGDKYGPFDLAAIPIGAYKPVWFMHPQHITPAEAIQVHKDLKSEKSFGIHWGTFLLADDGYKEPAEDLIRALDKENEPTSKFFLLRHGQVFSTKEAPPQHWVSWGNEDSGLGDTQEPSAQ